MRSRLALIILALSAVVVGCAGPDPLAAESVATTSVAIVDNGFEPIAIEVPVGSQVQWTWEGRADHNVVSDTFESELQREGTFTHTFDDAGDVTYICTIHPAMRGAVRVVDS